jgi:hypothetical protein
MNFDSGQISVLLVVALVSLALGSSSTLAAKLWQEVKAFKAKEEAAGEAALATSGVSKAIKEVSGAWAMLKAEGEALLAKAQGACATATAAASSASAAASVAASVAAVPVVPAPVAPAVPAPVAPQAPVVTAVPEVTQSADLTPAVATS